VCAVAVPTGPVVAASYHDVAPTSPAASRGAWLPPSAACSLRSSHRLWGDEIGFVFSSSIPPFSSVDLVKLVVW